MKGLIKFALNNIPRPWLIRMSYPLKRMAPLFYSGNKFEDPIDGRCYRKLLPYGYGDQQRENALAPASLSLERHRLMWLYLKNETDFFNRPQKVLHIAPEQCFLDIFRKLKHLDYTTADLESPLADVLMDVQDIPFDDNTFDVVICNHVMEHIPDDRKAMREILRILKPGGYAILQIPQDLSREDIYEDASIVDPEERAKHFGQYDHVRVYGNAYFDRLREEGFEVEAIDYSEKIGPELTQRYALSKGELLPICRK